MYCITIEQMANYDRITILVRHDIDVLYTCNSFNVIHITFNELQVLENLCIHHVCVAL